MKNVTKRHRRGIYIPARYVTAFFAGEITLAQIAKKRRAKK